MHELRALFIKTLASGLRRKNITSCSKWAESYRVMGKPRPGPWRTTYHPWLKEMMDAKEGFIVGQKAAQMGYTEMAINKTFYNIDILGNSVLYVLPSIHPDAHDFSTSRFDPALEASEHLRSLFSDTKNIGHKRAGSANLYIRGSRSRSALKSLPVALLNLDEVDEMEMENIPLVLERLSGQQESQTTALSTPTIPNYGINTFFCQSTQEYWFFPCPCCQRRIKLTYPECLVIPTDDWTDIKIMQTKLICPECRGELKHEEKPVFLSKGEWVKSNPGKLMRGFHINQLYSCADAVRPHVLAIQALKAQTNETDEQEFFNSKLGLPHAVEGSKVTDTDIQDCTKNYIMVGEINNAITTIGIDVGKWLHIEIDQWFSTGKGSDLNLRAKARLLKAMKVMSFDELDIIMKQYHATFAVIDGNPERRKAEEFAKRFWGKVRLCFYGNSVAGRSINIHADDHANGQILVTIDRTSWLDLSLGRVKRRAIDLPSNLPAEWKSHMKTLTRVYEKHRISGEVVGRYIKDDTDQDHYAHARNYAELALPFGVSLASGTTITDLVI